MLSATLPTFVVPSDLLKASHYIAQGLKIFEVETPTSVCIPPLAKVNPPESTTMYSTPLPKLGLNMGATLPSHSSSLMGVYLFVDTLFCNPHLTSHERVISS